MIDLGLMDLIKAVLNVSTADVNEAREALLDEQRTVDARYAASSALVHPEGSTTPINEAYSRAQGRVADLRAKALKELPAAFKLLMALQVAEERRVEALRHRDMKWDQAFAKDALGVDPAVADWFARLHKHGVHPSYLKQQAGEMVAIIADLVTWKAKDPKFRDPNNPWRAVLRVYASRRIEKPIISKNSKAERSVPGTPTRDRHISDLGDYMFNEMVSAAWDEAPSAPDQSDAQAAVTGDVEPKPTVIAEAERQPIDMAPNDTSDMITAGEVVTPPEDCQPSALPVSPPAADEYARPSHITDVDAEKLRSAGKQWVDMDHDWPFDLKCAIGWSSSDEAEMISAVERAKSPLGETPFSYFLDAAKRDGVDAGHAAYRDATIRRFAFEFATMDKWKDVRTNLGLAW